ncbi:MAG: tetraspanin family protein [archaeon]|nr:tetraspanin family protein [archaeon]
MFGGLALFAGGIYVMVVLGNMGLSDLFPVQLPIGIIVLGAVVALFSTMVCCAARRKSPKLMGFTSIIIFLVFLAQVGVSIAIYVIYSNIATDLANAWYNAPPAITNATEIAFNCTGWYNLTDTNNNAQPSAAAAASWDDDSAAASVAIAASAAVTAAATAAITCSEKVTNFMSENLFWIATSAMILAGLELFGIFALCCMCRAVKREHKHHDQKHYQPIA